ncbi:MAG: hypothetical protein ABIJ08_04380 [Nanoarchaeota archaeon]
MYRKKVENMDGLYQCGSCKKKFKFEDIRYASDGKRLVCKTCFHPVKKETTKYVSDDDKEERIRVICVNCRYKFSIKKKLTSKPICPYCGKGNLMKDQTTAENILKDISEDTKGIYN